MKNIFNVGGKIEQFLLRRKKVEKETLKKFPAFSATDIMTSKKKPAIKILYERR